MKINLDGKDLNIIERQTVARATIALSRAKGLPDENQARIILEVLNRRKITQNVSILIMFGLSHYMASGAFPKELSVEQNDQLGKTP